MTQLSHVPRGVLPNGEFSSHAFSVRLSTEWPPPGVASLMQPSGLRVCTPEAWMEISPRVSEALASHPGFRDPNETHAGGMRVEFAVGQQAPSAVATL